MPANRDPMQRHLLIACLSASLLGGSQALAEQQLYRWVDAQGQTHFSDVPPSDAGSDRAVEVVPIPSAPVPAPADDRYSITNQLEWMRQDRERRAAARRQEAAIQLERERLQVQEAEARARAAEAEAARAQTPTYVYPLWPSVPPQPHHHYHESDRPPRDRSGSPPDQRSLTRPGLSLTRPGLSLDSQR